MRFVTSFLFALFMLASSVVVAQSDYLRDDQVVILQDHHALRMPLLRVAVAPPLTECGWGMQLVQERELVYLITKYSPTAPNKMLPVLNQASAAINITTVNSRSGAYRSRLVAVETVVYTPSATLFGDITWMYNDPQVAAIRARYPNATIGLWVESDSSADGLGGMAAGGYGSTIPPYHVIRFNGGDPFAIIAAVHEWGHNVGMHHQEDDPITGPDQKPSFSYGWVYPGDSKTPGRRDIMSTWLPNMCPLACPTEFLFSNSSLGFGIPGETENYRMVGLAYQAMGSTPICVPLDAGPQLQ
jgi:hypothetical protein